MVVLLIIFLLVVIATLSYTYLCTKKEPFRPPPGPKQLPLIGNLHQIDLSLLHISFTKLAQTYGPIVGLRFGNTPVVVVQSAKEVLQTQDLNFCSRPSMVVAEKLSYNFSDVVFGQYNRSFREVKKISVVHLLNSKIVQSFGSIRKEEISTLLNKISSISSTSEVVNLSEMVMRFTCSNICRMAFGKRYDDGEGAKSRFHDLLNEAQALFITLFFSDYIPSIGWLDRLCGHSSRLRKTYEHLDAFYEEMIVDHVDPNRRKSNQEDIIDVLLGLKKQRNSTFGLSMDHIKGLLMDIIDVLLGLKKQRNSTFGLSMDHIKGLLMNVFIGGTDTTATMVVWAMTELIKNPSAMKRVQEEIRSAAGNKDYVGEEDVQNLEYFKAVVKETFRLHPAAPLLVVREAINKTKVDGYDILPKTLVHINAYAIGRDPASWENPESFMPERFLGSSIDLKGQDFELIPFGSGRRICPGLHLGLSTTELTLANLLNSFDWNLPAGVNKEDIDTDTIPGVTIHKKNPLLLVSKKSIVT